MELWVAESGPLCGVVRCDSAVDGWAATAAAGEGDCAADVLVLMLRAGAGRSKGTAQMRALEAVYFMLA
jgi:hypothetical protein